MSNARKGSLLEEVLESLVRHFGRKRVRAALANVVRRKRLPQVFAQESRRLKPKPKSHPSVRELIDALEKTDPRKRLLLMDFNDRLAARELLPESQDIRQFASTIGVKGLNGRSRRELVTHLVRFMIEQPLERVLTQIGTAANVSEQNRRRGFSVIADKLLADGDR